MRLPTRVLAGPVAVGRGLVDDRDERRALRVGREEVAAAQERRAEGGEEARCDRVVVRVHVLPRRRGVALGRERDAHAGALHRHGAGDRRGADPRRRAEALEEVRPEALAAHLVVPLAVEVDERDGPAVDREADVRAVRAPEALDEEEGAREEDPGERHLHAHERLLRQRAAEAAAGERHALQRGHEVLRAGGPQRGREAERDAAGERRHHREREDARVDAGRGHRRDREAVGDRRAQQGHGPVRDRDAGGGAEAAEEQALDEELPREPPARGADREANGDLLAPPLAAHEQERGDVGAGDQQHERGGSEQEPREPAHPRALVRVHDRVARGQELGERVLVTARLGGRAPRGDRVELGLRRGHRHAGLQAPHHVEPREAAVLQHAVAAELGQRDRGHRRRHPQLRERVEADAVEAGGGHADDGERVAIEAHRRPDRARVGAEEPPPEPVAQHDDAGSRPGAASSAAASSRPACARTPEELEVAAAHDAGGEPLGPSAVLRQVHGQRVRVGGQGRERRRLVAVVLEHGVRRVADSVAAREARRLPGVDAHQLLRLRHRKRPEEHGVDEAEDGRVRPDAEGEHERRRRA